MVKTKTLCLLYSTEEQDEVICTENKT